MPDFSLHDKLVEILRRWGHGYETLTEGKYRKAVLCAQFLKVAANLFSTVAVVSISRILKRSDNLPMNATM
jgi:hypothetical protein